jgi:hypothetical protein
MKSDRMMKTTIGLIFTLVAIDLAAQEHNVSAGALASSVEEAKLIVSKNYEFALMGNAVSIDGNRAVVGAERDDDVYGSQGTVYVYEFDGADWIQTHQINAADGESGDNFGSALAVEGDDLLVGASGVSLDGAVYVFEYGRRRHPGPHAGQSSAAHLHPRFLGTAHALVQQGPAERKNRGRRHLLDALRRPLGARFPCWRPTRPVTGRVNRCPC